MDYDDNDCFKSQRTSDTKVVNEPVSIGIPGRVEDLGTMPSKHQATPGLPTYTSAGSSSRIIGLVTFARLLFRPHDNRVAHDRG